MKISPASKILIFKDKLIFTVVDTNTPNDVTTELSKVIPM